MDVRCIFLAPFRALAWFFTPPDFDDPEDARKAKIINTLSVAALIVFTVVAVTSLLNAPKKNVAVYIFLYYALYFILPALVKRRQVFAASIFWAIYIFILHTLIMYTTPNPHQSYFKYNYFSSVVVVGLLLGRRYLVIYSLICITSIIGLFVIYKTHIHILPVIVPTDPALFYLINPIIVMIMIVTTSFVALSEIERSLRLAREKLEESQKSQKALEEYQENLEQTIGMRTQELNRSKVQAESASRAKGDFLARMSHEIRTPLNAILGFSQLLHKEEMPPSIGEKVTIIRRSGEHLLGLINEVLEMSKIDAGHVEINEHLFSMHDLVKDVRAMLKFRSDSKGLLLDVHVDENVPRYLIADEGKIRQIFINLLANAIKFTSHGKVDLRLAMTRDEADILTLHGQVEDTGEGIAPDEISRLFMAFEQTSSGVRSHKGTGLGLAITKHYLEAMGGDISVDSKVGSGTCFQFHFRVKEPVEMPPDEITGKIIGIKKSLRILVVDDNLENRVVLRSILDSVGFETKEVSDGSEAIKLYNEWKPDVIMMDLMMPGMDGYEAARLIRQNNLKTYIIAVTAAGLVSPAEHPANHDFDNLIIKPYKEKDIFDALAACGTEFIFGEVSSQYDNEPEETLPDAAPGVIPADLLEKIRQGALKARPDLILETLDEVRFHDIHAAKKIEDMVNGFNYERLMEYVETGLAHTDRYPSK